MLYQLVKKIPDDMTFINASQFKADDDAYDKRERPLFFSLKPQKKPDKKTTRKLPSEENAIQEEAFASTTVTPVLMSTSPTAVQMPMATAIVDMSGGLSADIGLYDGIDSDGLGSGMGGGDGLGSTQGGGSTLTGTFYDLKQKKSGAPFGLNGDSANAVIEVLSKFFVNWDEHELNQYDKSDTKLYASNWYLPVAKAGYGPIAFEVEAPDKDEKNWECKPSAWLAVYRGRVIAPKTGKFRFIGTGDDFLAVRFDGRTVLEAGHYIPTCYEKNNTAACHIAEPASRRAFLRARENKGYEMITSIRDSEMWNRTLGGLVAGTPFKVEEGEVYEMEVAVADITGDTVGFVLFIEDVTDGKNNGARQYDLFRTCDTNPDIDKIMQALKDVNCDTDYPFIPFNEDSWVWEVVPED